jgi:hypothetical protein
VLHRWPLPKHSSRESANSCHFNVELGTPAFRWGRWEIGAERAEEQSEQPLSVEAAHYAVAGKVYVGNPTRSGGGRRSQAGYAPFLAE